MILRRQDDGTNNGAYSLGADSSGLKFWQGGFANDSTADIIFDKNGNVGIGTTDPQSKLHVNNNHGIALSGGDSAWGDTTIIETGYTTGFGDWTDIKVPSGDDEDGFLRLLSNGNVGIGTTSPSVDLDIRDNGNTGLRLYNTDTTNSKYAYLQLMTQNYTDTGDIGSEGLEIGLDDTTGTAYMAREVNGGIKSSGIAIDKNGNVGIGTTSPDAKLDIRDSSGTSEIQLQERTLAYRHAYKTLSTEEGGSWYRIAEKGTGRASARFAVNEVQSGKHSTAAFYASSFYSNNSYWNSSLSLLNRSIHSGNSCIRKVRIVTGDATYDPAYVEIFVYNNATSTNDCRASFSIYDNEHNEGWYPVDFLEVPEDAESPEYEALSPGQHSDNVQPYYYSDSVLDFTGTPIMAVANKTGDIFRAAANGTVGIGTTAPAARLHVESTNREDSINRVCPAGTLWASFFDGNADHDWNGDSILDGRDYGALDGIDANDYLEDNECVVFGTSTGNDAGATPASGEFWIDTDLDRAVDAGEIITGATTTLDGDAVVAARPNKCEDGYVWLNQRVNEGDEPVAGECIAPQLDENSDISRVDFTGESCPTGTQQRDENEDGNTDDGECHIPALFVQSNGNVGIGTTSPGAKLQVFRDKTIGGDVNNLGKATILAENAQELALGIDVNEIMQKGNNLHIGASDFGSDYSAGNIYLRTDPESDGSLSEYALTVRKSGKVGIGTSSPDKILHIKDNYPIFRFESEGEGAGAASYIEFYDSDSRQGWIGYGSSSNTDLAIVQEEADANVIITASQIGINTATPSAICADDATLCVNGKIYTQGIHLSSDSRLKTAVETIPSALEKILSLRGVTFEWKTEEFPERNFADGTQIGLIAQEVEAVFPELVSQGEYKSVSYANLVSPLIEAIRELHALYQGHADRLAALEAQNAELETQNAHQDERIAHQDELIVQLEVRLAALEAAQ